MPKGKQVTAEEIKDVLSTMMEATQQLADMMNRINNGRCDDLPDALEYAHEAMVISRDAGDFALRMLSQHNLHVMCEKNKETTAKLEALNAGTTGRTDSK